MHPGAVMIVPMLDDGRLVVERQHRYPLGQVLLEFPAGKLEPARRRCMRASASCSRRPATARANGPTPACMHNAPAYSTEFIEIWFARGLVAGEQQLDDGEFLEVLSMAEADELDALAASGELTDAKTLVGLLRLQQWRAGAWTPTWQLRRAAAIRTMRP